MKNKKEKAERKMEARVEKITEKGKALLLAYDQGLEHGPKDFFGRNIDPSYILEIAKKGKFNGIILQKGVAERYYKKENVPLILKLNGKTNLYKGEPVSLQICSVREAIKLGASAVGYTIYLGSRFEAEMLREFGKIEEQAHAKGLPVIAWIYPRGKNIKRITPKIIEYAVRVGLEIGADFVKVKYTGSIESFRKVVEAAGKCKVLCLGGEKISEKKILKQAEEIIKAGATGMAIGRNIWQHPKPLKIAKALRAIIFQNKSISEASKMLK